MLSLTLRISVLAFACVVLAASIPQRAFGGAESGFGVSSGGGLAAEDEAFKTELFSGASTASVPFIVPAGPNGFQPSLGLRYNAQAGNSWVGRGWLLEVPRVERMTKYGTPSYSDDSNTGDRFALSDDRLVRDDAGFYHATRENFSRIERVDVAGAIDHWIVRSTNGETRWFGSTADSRTPNGPGNKLSWLLSRAEDANGNFINYSYATTATTGDDGQPYLKQITYSFQGDEALGSATIRSIDFDLENRPDPSISYRAGVRQEMRKRLGAVRVNYAGVLVTRYELVYADEESLAPASGASLLRRVGRYGSDGTSLLPSDTFSYSSTAQPTWTLDSALSTRLGQLTVGAGASLEHFSLSSGNWLVSDLNGDGAPDLLATKAGYESAYINDKTATLFPAQDFPLTNIFDPETPVTNEAVRYVDYDGDGVTDSLFSIDIPGYGRTNAVKRSVTYVWMPDSRAYATPPVPMVSICSYTVVLDVNGDGLPDLLNGNATCVPTTGSIYLNTGSGWEPTPNTSWSGTFAYALTVLGANVRELIAFDWNGDGLLDLAKDANHDGVLDAARVMINTGTGWLQDPELLVLSGLRPADLNGDGHMDHAGASSQLSGGYLLGAATFALPAPFSTPGTDKRLIDIDGDGLVDLVRGDGTTTEVYRNTTPTAGNLLTHIDRAAGATVDITYQPTTAGSCYDVSLTDFDFDRNGCNAGLLFVPLLSGSAANCTFPLLYYGVISGYVTCVMPYEQLPFVVETVESVAVNDATGTGNIRTDRVRFTQGRFDPTEREFRGFGRVLERPHYYEYTSPKGGQVKLGAIRVTQFYQLQFLRGEIAAVDLWSSEDDDLDVATDALVERTVNAYAYTRGDLGQTFVLIGTAIVGTGQALACDPFAPVANPTCDLYDLQQDPYATQIAVPSPLPYAGFQAAFCGAANPSNRDCAFAYLTLPVASQTRSFDTTAPYTIASTRWHDAHGNVQAEWNRGNDADASDDRVTIREFAAPTASAPPNFYAAPRRVYQQGASGTAILADTLITYDDVPYGSVRRGRAVLTTRVLKDPVHGITNVMVATAATYADSNAGLPTTVSDPYAPGDLVRWTTYGYDAGKSFVRTTQRGSLTTTTTYDPVGAPPGLGIAKWVDDPNAARTSYSADTFGRPLTVTLPGIGLVEQRVYFDTQGYTTSHRVRISTYTNALDILVRQYTDGLGRVTRTTTAGLNESDVADTIRTDTRYDVLGRVKFQERPTYLASASSSGTSFRYDLRGRTRFTVQPDGGIQETEYDGLTTRHYDALNNRTDSVRDGAGSVTAVRQYATAGGSGPAQTTTYRYDPLGRLAYVCDPAAASCGLGAGAGLPVALDPKHTIVLSYDTLSRRVRLVDPDRGEERTRYDGAGRVTLATDGRGKGMIYQYEALGRLSRSYSDNPGSPTEVNHLVTYGDQLPDATRPPYSKGRMTSDNVGWHLQYYAYDAAGRTTGTETAFQPNTLLPASPGYAMNYSYDALGRVTKTTYPDGEVVTQTYDLMGLDTVVSNQRSYVTDIRHNAEGRTRTVNYGNGDIRTLQYQPNHGYLSSITGRPASSATNFVSRTYGYDLAARLTSIGDGVTSAEALSNIQYDGISRLKQFTRNAQTLTYDYDTVGNLIKNDGTTQLFQHPTRPHALYESANPNKFSYDPGGNLTARNGQTLTYDDANRLLEVSGALKTRFGYDSGTERTFRLHGADESLFLGPDYEIKNGRRFVKTIRAEGAVVAQVSGILPGTSASVPWARGAPIDPAPLGLALGALALLAALAAAAARNEASPGWQRALAAGLVVTILAAPALPALAAPKGNVHADDRLDAADAMLVVRSLMGKITLTPTQTTDADVGPLQSGEPAGDGRVDANDANLLQRAAQGIDVDGDGLSGTQERLLGLWPIDRDSNNNGVADNNEDTDQDGIPNSTEIALGYLAWDADTDGDGYVDGDDPAPLAATGTLVAYVHTDHLGGSAVLTDTVGVVVRSIRYQAFGRVKSNTKPGPADTLDPAQKYTGQQLDDDTGLYYYGARYYDAQYGRFISADPIIPEPLDPQALNRYAYVRNSPFNGTDPTGHSPIFDSVSGDWFSYQDPGLSSFAASDGYYDGDWRSSDSSDSSNYALLEAGLVRNDSSGLSYSFGDATYPLDIAPTPYGSYSSQGQQLPQLGIPDLQTGDVLLTGDGGLAQYLKGTGEYGHAAIVLEAQRDALTVLSSDNQGVYIRDNTYSGVGGRSFDVFRVPGINRADLRAYSDNLFTGGGLGQYLGDRGANVCSSVCARALEAAGGPRVDRSVGGAVTPQALGRALGPPIGQIYVPLRRLP